GNAKTPSTTSGTAAAAGRHRLALPLDDHPRRACSKASASLCGKPRRTAAWGSNAIPAPLRPADLQFIAQPMQIPRVAVEGDRCGDRLVPSHRGTSEIGTPWRAEAAADPAMDGASS